MTEGSNTMVILYFFILFLIIWTIKVIYDTYGDTLSNVLKSGQVSVTNVLDHTIKYIPFKRAISLINDSPHSFIVGKTRSGKTLFTRALLAHRTGEVIIIDPKNKPGKWGKIEGIGLDDNLSYDAINSALDMVLKELQQRQRMLNRGTDTFTPLHVVIDELPTVAQYTDMAREVFLKVSVIGAELNVRLIVISQSDRVKTLKIDGMGDIRENFLFICLGNKARELVPDIEDTYPCILATDNGYISVDLREVPKMATSSLSLVPFDMSYFEGSTSKEELVISDTKEEYQSTDTSTGTLSEEEAMIAEMLREGFSANKIVPSLKGSRADRLQKIRMVREKIGL